MPRVVHFEIPAENPQILSQFYTDVFGWKIKQWGPEKYWLVSTGTKEEAGIDGAIYQKDWMDKTVNTVQVENLEEYLERVKKAGGKILRGPMEIPTIGRNAYAEDPEGNMFGILEPAKKI